MTPAGPIRLVEVGPRDGLQNEAVTLPVATRIALFEALAAAGLPAVEAGSFVSPKWVPQMADTAAVLAGLRRRPGTSYPVLVPNRQGLDAAIAAKVEEIAVFGAASESFSRRNINCSIAESLEDLLARTDRPRDWQEDMRRGLAVIGARADSLSRFMEAYSRLARLPPPQRRPGSRTNWSSFLRQDSSQQFTADSLQCLYRRLTPTSAPRACVPGS